MDKKQREATRRQEDQALNRSLLWVGAAVLLEVLLLFINRYYLNFRGGGFEARLAGGLFSLMRVLVPVGTVGTAICLGLALLQIKKGADLRLPVALMCACGALAFCAHVTLNFGEPGMRMLYLLVAACAGLALVYHLYQREFFLAAAVGGLGTIGLWFVRYDGGVCLEAVVALAGVILVAVFALWLKKRSGIVRFGEAQRQIFPHEAGYLVILASCLFSMGAMSLAMVMGAGVAYYLIFVMIAWLFALLVYYTVKMM